MIAQPELKDPKDLHPKPDFPRQPQERPGLAQDMTPTPDHGEESYKGHGRLKGRKALVTGGDSGIGRAAVIAFAREGADVAFNYLESESEDAKQVVKLIEDAGRKAVALPGDIADEEFCKKLVADAHEALGGLDILVNNAGRQTFQKTIDELTTEQFDNTFKVNVYAPFWISKAAIPLMPPGSTIINTASSQSFSPSAMLLDYAQTKACNVTFTKALAQQVMDKGIRVNAVAPGPFWTALQSSGGQPQDNVTEFGSSTLFDRPGQPVEIAPIYVLLASQDSSYMTGEVVGATGGKTPY
ncbi:SDR family oxidoreductase [Roseibacillus persicicus]|uniref:SDR family oxidoreductase n=1 Tax=Roseibacillus persicicus TaxID=454148 RepID=UPI00280D3EF2|nr:SDR family oxidoreductase [Roseibacillus persicicus]MDQ8192555.1 SDR family oxidoreductase [Roseibacillus persicicus]